MNAYVLGDKPAGQGIPIPVLIWGVVVMAMAFIVNRTKFGRYVYAIGGNPEAALLVGIPVKRVMLKLFMLLAVLVTIAAIVSVSRLNAGTNSLGTNMELYVIAAAVIGGVGVVGRQWHGAGHGAGRADHPVSGKRAAAAGRQHRLGAWSSSARC